MMGFADIEQQIKLIVNDLGLQLWACEYLPQGRHSLLRIYIDKSDGIMIEDCEMASRAISAYMDVEDPIKGNYTLEVSSPGIPRLLFTLEHYKKYLLYEIEIKLLKPINNVRKFKGIIQSVNDNEVIILKVKDDFVEVPLSMIVKAHVTGE